MHSEAPSGWSWGRVPARWELAALLTLLALFWGLAWASQREESVTFDEAAHLPVGLYYLRTGDFRFEPLNSPLTRMVEALPLALDRSVVLTRGVGWRADYPLLYGWEFMKANPAAYHRLFARCRRVTTALAGLLLVLTWGAARRLYGPASGLAAAALFAFDPNIIAHSQLVTIDLGVTLAFFATVLAAWTLARRPSWPRTAAVGALLGMAILAKISSMLLVALVPLLLLMARPGGERRSTTAARIGAIMLTAWLVICSFYFWRGFGTAVDDYAFRSQALRRAAMLAPGWLPLPFPAASVTGLDRLMELNEGGSYDYFLGRMAKAWWPHYLLTALLVKTPAPTLVLLGLGLGSLGWKRRECFWRDEAFMVIPGVGFFVFISLTAGMHLGLRYALPSYPFLFVTASRLFSARLAGPRVRAGAAVMLGWGALCGLLAYPQYLPYFNFLAGGREQGYKILADSNLDWGQDLIRLKHYQERERLGLICLAYFGPVDPKIYGIDAAFPAAPEQCEVLAVSVQYVVGFAPFQISDEGVIDQPDLDFSYLQKRRPDAVVGSSIWVYRRRDR